jgi:hypothetical protein
MLLLKIGLLKIIRKKLEKLRFGLTGTEHLPKKDAIKKPPVQRQVATN